MFGCSKPPRVLKSTKHKPELLGKAQGRQEASKGEESLLGIWILGGIGSQNFSPRDVTAAMSLEWPQLHPSLASQGIPPRNLGPP